MKLKVPEGEGLSDLQIELDPGRTITGRVVDDATGIPVKRAIVRSISTLDPDENSLLLLRRGHDQNCIHAETDDSGLFTLCGLEEVNDIDHSLGGEWLIVAVHPDYAEGMVKARPGEDEKIEIRLRVGHRIFGKAYSDSGMPVGGVLITMAGKDIPLPGPTLTGPDGSFRTPPLQSGRIYLCAGPPPWSSEASLGFTKECRWVELTDQDLEVNSGPSPDQAAWRGTLYGLAGKPVAGGEVRLTPVHSDILYTFKADLRLTSTCDHEGRFEFGKLALGTYKVTLLWTAKVEWGMITFDRPGMLDRDLHVTGGMVNGVVIDGLTGVPPVMKGRSGVALARLWSPYMKSYTSKIGEDGQFSLKGLPASSYNVVVKVDDFERSDIQWIRWKKVR